MDQLAAWVKAGPEVERDGVVRWRRKALADRIKQEMKIEVSERTVGNYLDKLGFRRMTVRPEHPKTDKEAQEALKKLLKDHNGRPFKYEVPHLEGSGSDAKGLAFRCELGGAIHAQKLSSSGP